MSTNEKGPASKGNWPKDEFARDELIAQFWWVGLVVIIAACALLLPLLKSAFSRKPVQVIAYCAQDQEYAEPILGEFHMQTGAKVLPVFDSEAVKTVGMANRLLAERSHPQCDVFWGNEELRTRQLAAQKVFRETNGWTSFGYRSRRLVINTNLLPLATAPHSLLELTNPVWRGKVAVAYPQFGTTATHFLALRQLWGDAAWEAWCRGLAGNEPRLVDGNSVVVKMVGRGEAAVGLSDSDDVAAGQREGLPIVALPMNAETLLIPNTVAVVRGAPNGAAAEALFQYLQRPEIARQLVDAHALEGVSAAEVTIPTLKVDWDLLLRDLEPATATLNKIFLK
jgi:iron(III) transport system substrate-binding protein